MCKKFLRKHLKNAIFGVLFGILGIFGLITSPLLENPVFAEPDITESSETTESSENQSATPSQTENSTPDPSQNTDEVRTCAKEVGTLGWLVCSATEALGKAVDSIYSQIEKLLVVEPISFEESSPVYQIWQIMRDITNILFVVFLLVVIYSQITGLGISNYGIKKALPKLIIAAVLVNLSYLLCALAVDASNVVGASIRGLFDTIQTQAMNTGGFGNGEAINWTTLTAALIGGATVGGIAIISFIWPLIAALIGAIISVLVGLVTLGLRHALVIILVMIAPVALVCYLLPNTDKWFKKWKDIFFSMLIFYPMFSFIFGAAQLAGWALIASAMSSGSAFMLIVGLAVQVLPLILSISLMKMSGTVLGAVSSKLDSLGQKPQEGIRANLAQRHELARLRRINNSALPSASLQRYLDKRAAHRAADIKNEEAIRTGRAEIYAQNKIIGNRKYDPAYNEDYKNGTKTLGTNSSSRAAKRAMDISLAAQAATKNAAHVLSNYGDYHKDTAEDRKLHAIGGKNYLELYRANLVELNDAFSDEDWVMGEYDKYRNQYANPTEKDPRARAQREYDYKHYVVGAAGALGKKGELTVLGEVISKSAANEAKRKSFVNYAFSKYGYNKREFRNFAVGYYNDDDGYAVDPKTNERLKFKDKNGVTRTELVPGELFWRYPEELKRAAYDKYEVVEGANGKKEKLYYFDATDQKGNFIGRVYKNDTPAMKEILQNWDMPITDPINNLYGMLAGIEPGTYKAYGLDGVGLSGLSTTIGRAMLSSGFKDKASHAGPMYAQMVGDRLIKNPLHQALAVLDNLDKTAKPSGFNTQDYAALDYLATLMDDKNWQELLFNKEDLVTYRNVNKESLKVIRKVFDEATQQTIEQRINPADATQEELEAAVIGKFLNRALPKFYNLMSRVTPNIIDNQKPSAQKSWHRLLHNIAKLTDNTDIRELLSETSTDSLNHLKELHERYPAFTEPIDTSMGDTSARARAMGLILKGNQSDGKNNQTKQTKRMREAEIKANQGTSDINKPFVKGEAELQADKDYERSIRNSSMPIGVENTTDALNRIDLLAAQYAYDTIGFTNAARKFIDDMIPEDYRWNHVADDFDGYLVFEGKKDGVTTDTIASALKDLVYSYISD